MSVLLQVVRGRQPAVAARLASLSEGPWLITAAVMLVLTLIPLTKRPPEGQTAQRIEH
jgi:hypothetical protein